MDSLHGRDLKTAFWINQHQGTLARVSYSIVGIVTALIWLWFIINVIIYIKDYNKTKAAEQSLLLVSGNFETVSRPVNLTILDSDVIDAGGDTADAFALVKNSNSLFAARFSYSFTVAGNTAEFSDGFIMPNQEQYFVVRGVSIDGLDGGANFDMQNIIWEKLHGEPPNVQFDVSEIAFGQADVITPVKEEDLEDKTGANDVLDENSNTNSNVNSQVVSNTNEPVRLINTNNNQNTNDNANTNEEVVLETPDDITDVPEEDSALNKSDITALSTIVSNNSPVGFRTASIIAIVKDDSNQVIAVHKQVAKNFNSFDQQAVNMNWPRRFIFSAKPEIQIYADYLDKNNLILLGEE